MRFSKGAIRIFGSDESGNKNMWDLKYGFGGIKMSAKNGDLIVKEKNNVVESDYDDLKKKTKCDGVTSTKYYGATSTYEGATSTKHDGATSTKHKGATSTKHDGGNLKRKSTNYDGGLKSKSTKNDCVKSTNDEEVMRTARRCSGTATEKTNTINDEKADVIFICAMMSNGMVNKDGVDDDEKPDEIFSGKYYGTTKNEDDDDDDTNTSKIDEHDDLSKESVRMYQFGTQVSAKEAMNRDTIGEVSHEDCTTI